MQPHRRRAARLSLLTEFPLSHRQPLTPDRFVAASKPRPWMVRELRYRRKRCCMLALCGAAMGFGVAQKWLVKAPPASAMSVAIANDRPSAPAKPTTLPADPNVGRRTKLDAELASLASQIQALSETPPAAKPDEALRSLEVALADAAQQTLVVEADLQRALAKAGELDPLLKQYAGSLRDAERDLQDVPQSNVAEVTEANAAVEQVKTELYQYANPELRAKIDVARAARENKDSLKPKLAAAQSAAKAAAAVAAEEAANRAHELTALREQEAALQAALAAIPVAPTVIVNAAPTIPAPVVAPTQEKSFARLLAMSPTIITANATILGMCGGILLTFVLARFDRRVKMIDDLIALAAGEQVIGPMPRPGTRRGSARTDSPFSHFITALAENACMDAGFTVVCGLGATGGRTSIAIGLASHNARRGVDTLVLDRDRKAGQLTRRLASISVSTETPDFAPLQQASTPAATPRLPDGTPDAVGELFAEALLDASDRQQPSASASPDITAMIDAACTESAHPILMTRADHLFVAPAVRDAATRGMTAATIKHFLDTMRAKYPRLIADISSSGEEASILLRSADNLVLAIPLHTPRQSVQRAITLIRERSDAPLTLVLDTASGPAKSRAAGLDAALPWEETDLTHTSGSAAHASFLTDESGKAMAGTNPDHADSIHEISDILQPHVVAERPRKVA